MDPIFHLIPSIRSNISSKVNIEVCEAIDLRQQIIDAIRDQDSGRAKKAMIAHLAVAQTHVL